MDKDTVTLNGHIGANIQRIRKEHGLSHAQLAETVGISQYILQDVEEGNERVTVALVDALTVALGVGYSDFLEGV